MKNAKQICIYQKKVVSLQPQTDELINYKSCARHGLGILS